ncbi:MAG: hypothetical protein WBP85_08975 [Terracidiphilus sp.]
MAKRKVPSKKAKALPIDVNQRMHLLGSRSTGETEAKLPDVTAEEISRVMSALGSRGGKKGGKRRMETMTQKQRSDIAFRAAQARWNKEKKG